MTTPIYKGNGQPVPVSDGWLGSWFGGTPAYQGAGQPTQKPPSLLGGSQPAYQSAPVTDASMPDGNAGGCGPIAIVIPRQVMDPQQ